MTKILVTGGGGYIGSVAVSEFLKKGYEVVVLDNFSTGFRQPLENLQKEQGEGKIKIYDRDIGSSIDEVLDQEQGIEAAIHYAANCSVDESMRDPAKYFANNTLTSNKLFTSLLSHNIQKVVFSSTCAVFGEAEYIPLDENHPTNPTNPYGASKRMTEQMLYWYKNVGLKSVILRYFNVCGATDDGSIGDSKKPSVHLVQNAVRGALGIEPFRLTCGKFDTPDGSPIRDYVNVVDLNHAHALALDYLLNGGESDIFNLGTGTGNSVIEIVKKVEELTGGNLPLEQGEARKGEYAKMIASIEKAEKILGWKPVHSLEDSIQSSIAWYKEHPNGWDH